MNKKTERASKEAGPVGTKLIMAPTNGPSPKAISQREVAVFAAAAGRDEPARPAGGGVYTYFHALRRHWPLAITLGLACGAAAAFAAWQLATDRYTVVSLLKISASEKPIVFKLQEDSVSSFDIFKATQQQLLTSDTVLIAALRREDAKGLALVQKEDDPVRWLAQNIRVDFLGNSEIMRVSLTSEKPEEAATLVKAVVDAYMNEVVDVDRNARNARLEILDKLYNDKEAEMRKRKSDLRSMAEQLKTGDTGAMALKQKIALEAYADARNGLARLHAELQEARDELEVKKVWLDAVKTAQKQPADPADAASSDLDDPILAQLSDKIEEIDSHMAANRKTAKEPLLSKLAADYVEARKVLVEKQEKRRTALAARARKTTQGNLDPQIVQLNARINILAAQEKAAADDLEKARQEAERMGNSSIDLEMMKSDLQYLDRVLAPIADEREKLKVELRSAPRISIFQEAGTPKSPDGKPRIQYAALSGGGGFVAVVFLVLWWDVRKQRINSLADLSRGLGLTVVGAVPLLPQKMVRAGASGKRHRRWQNSLDHAVDAIAARVFLRKDAEGVRVVMVSSATQGEGKTTLAVQLARRLARTGERTLLVDYDLRRPSIHRIFGMPRGPGVSECLQKELNLGQVVHPTDAENLSVVTAGTALPDLLGPLANGVTTAFFEQARAGFTFVVVDGCPILPVIDGLLVSQHADTVLLSVRRDTSQAPQVLRACEKLAAFGSRKHVVVLNGSEEDVLGDYQEHVVSARIEAVAPKAGKA